MAGTWELEQARHEWVHVCTDLAMTHTDKRQEVTRPTERMILLPFIGLAC